MIDSFGQEHSFGQEFTTAGHIDGGDELFQVGVCSWDGVCFNYTVLASLLEYQPRPNTPTFF